MLTNDPFVQAKAWELATTARVPHPWLMNHTAVAWNYRMGNINAALGLPQLERLEDLIEQKVREHDAYAAELGLTCKFEGDASSRSNYWLNAILLEPLDHRRDEVLAALHGDGVACRTLFSPLHELPMYRDCPRDNLDYAKDVWCRVICLPSSPHLAGRL